VTSIAFFEDRVWFGAAVPAAVNHYLQKAVEARTRNRYEAEKLLWEARAEDPTCLPVYFALYKFYANARRLEAAERAALLALAEASRQGGFPPDWRKLGREPQRWSLYDSAAGLFYLFSLKALGFIRLRRGHADKAKGVLDQLERLDPEDRCGGSVIRALASSLDDGDQP